MVAAVREVLQSVVLLPMLILVQARVEVIIVRRAVAVTVLRNHLPVALIIVEVRTIIVLRHPVVLLQEVIHQVIAEILIDQVVVEALIVRAAAVSPVRHVLLQLEAVAVVEAEAAVQVAHAEDKI